VYPIDLSGRNALIAGVANKRSLAWGIAQALSQAGARLFLTYQGERLRDSVEKLAAELPGTALYECDVCRDESIDGAFERIAADAGHLEILVHAIAFARKEDLEGRFLDTGRSGFSLAMEVSAYSLLALSRKTVPLMGQGGSILSLSYIAAQRAVPSYNVMGTAKAGLEQITRQLAFELGPENIRVNAISAGPISTLSARGISGFTGILGHYREEAALRRNITTEEVGTAGLFLCSDLASGITGETIYVDAGYHVML
jgi:enoyl-[acyl-carrier protein] reductase I